MPGYAALALLGGLLLLFAERGRPTIILACYSLAALQMALLLYDPNRMIPSEESVAKGNAFLEEISKIDGEILMPELQFVQTRVGKKSYALGMAAVDILATNVKHKNYIKRRLRQEIAEAVRSRQFKALVPGRMIALPEKYGSYVFSRHLPYPPEFVTGATNFTASDLYILAPNLTMP